MATRQKTSQRFGEFIFVSDKQTDASFLIHHFLSFYLRAGCKVCFLGLVQSISQQLVSILILPKRWVKLSPSHSYTYFASKCVFTVVYALLFLGGDVLTTFCMGSFTVFHVNQGVSLTQAREKGQLVFIEGLNESLGVLLQGEASKGTREVDFLRDPSSGLRGLYDFVWDNVRGAVGGGEEWGPPVLLLDDFSVVLSLWVSVGAALDFSHYCRATVCSELQVEVCWRGQCDRQQTQKKLFQYKVHDKGAFFFTRGMSSAVP
uniref:Uncharacterized protein n=1 Tax=Hucho hucho TaxID=62062 RepID=A0A4W5QMN0_9TELE